MNIRNLVAALCAALFAWPCLAAPLETYGKLPSIEQARISPDGVYLALILTDGEERRIVTKNLATGEASGVVVGDTKVRDLDWAGSKQLLITTSTTAKIANVSAPRAEWRMLFTYNVESKKLRRLLGDVDYGLNVLAGSPSVRMIGGQPIVFVEGYKFDDSGKGRIALFRIELERGKSRVVHAGYPDTRDWLVGSDGEPMAEGEFSGRTGRWALKVRSAGGWREIKSGESFRDPPYLMGLGRGPNSFLVAEFKDELTSVWEVSSEGVWGDKVFDADATPILDPASHHLIGFSRLVGDEWSYTFFAPKDQAAWRAVVSAYPGETVTLQSWSDDRSKLVVLVDSEREGPAYALVDLNTKKGSWIGGRYVGLKPADISPMRPIAFKAADGLALTGYLTTPDGRPGKGLPLIVAPHGGPANRDIMGFNWAAQALASRGYVVLQVNYRGSGGLGRELMEAGFGQWGRKMQSDLSDGVRHLAAQGVIDPKRVCIVGDDYGGYAALAGPSLDPGVYRCAAAVGGISDLGRFVAWSQQRYGSMGPRYWGRFMGVEDAKDPTLVKLSPTANVAKIDVPILLVHGRDDTVVPLEQSQLMADALTAAGKPVELLVLPGEDHWLSRGETRLAMLNAVVAFLEKHNPPN